MYDLFQEENMKKFNLAIEKGKRYFEDETVCFYFIATEFIFKKEEIVNGDYQFVFTNNNQPFFVQDLTIDVEKRKVIVENSHEDPLIESENYFFICGQLTAELIKKEYQQIQCLFFRNNHLLRKQSLSQEQLQQLFLLNEWHSYVEEYKIKTSESCIVRVHLGRNDATYYEEQYTLEKNDSFDFEKYLQTHEYVAVQCSYEKHIDIEEKHVFKGIKGIYNSAYYQDKNEYVPMFPFSKKYTEIKISNWIKISTINDLILYYQQNPSEIKKVFEMDEKFILNYYKKFKTSAIGKLYSENTPKIYHIETNICSQCDKKSACMQLVPSGLSELLFKKNLMVESFENCSIYKLMQE